MIQKHHGIFKHYYLNHIYHDINDSNLNRNRKILIIFHDMIANMNTNNKFQSTVKELFIRCKELNIYLVFITQSYFPVLEDVRLNSTHYVIMKIHKKRELQNIVIKNSVHIDYKDVMKIYRKYTVTPNSFLTIDAILLPNDQLCFRKNLLSEL